MALPDWENLPDDFWEKMEEAAKDPDWFRKMYLSNPFIPEVFPLEADKKVANRQNE